jgi:hypothetical protein
LAATPTNDSICLSLSTGFDSASPMPGISGA